MDTTGVYQIKNKVNGKLYIGESFAISNRKYQHFSNLRGNKHDNKHLQNAVNEYGIANFEHSILERIDTKDKKVLKEKEHEWCLLLNAYDEDFGYNILVDESKLNKFIENANRRKDVVSSTADENIIYQIDQSNNIVREWRNKIEVREFFNVSYNSIDHLLLGAYKGKNKKTKTYKGFVWVYKSDYSSDIDYSLYFIKKTPVGWKKKNKKEKIKKEIISYSERNLRRKEISLQNIETGEVKIFISQTEAAKSLNISLPSIRCLITGTRKKNGKIVKITQWKGWKIYKPEEV